MTSKTVHSCPSCSTLNTSQLRESVLLICRNCGSIVYERVMGPVKPKVSAIPPDWSFVQLNTTGEYKQQPFTVVGRIRLQLRNDYKNFWSAALNDGGAIWLMDSFASFAVLRDAWHTYTNSISDVRAGKTFHARKGLKLRGDFVEKCEGISYEGEIGSWKLFEPGFFFVQAANSGNEIAVFTIANKKDADFLSGEKVEVEQLALKNIIAWDEWK